MFTGRSHAGEGTPGKAQGVPPDKEMLSINEAAEVLDISEMRIRTLLRDRRLEGAVKVKVGETEVEKWSIPRAALDKYVATRGTFGKTGGKRGDGKAFVIRLKGPEQVKQVQEFLGTIGVKLEPRYNYNTDKQKAYRVKRKAALKEKKAAAKQGKA